MKTRLSIFLFISLLFFSCGDDSPYSPVVTEEEPYVITVTSQIEMVRDNYTMPDADADIFIYFGVYSLDLLGYDLKEDGNLVKERKLYLLMCMKKYLK